MTAFIEPVYFLGKTAGADLSAKQYHYVKHDGSGGVAVAGAGEFGIGFLMNTPALGEPCEIATLGGGAKGVLAGTLAAGALVKCDANGHLVALASNNDKAVAILCEGGVDNDIVAVQPIIAFNGV